jgi:peptide/nickel transport system ATP-binding protein
VDPRLIVADEAVSMVDVSIRISLLDLLHNLATEFHVTTLLITHDLAVARYFARRGRIAVMYLGRVVELADTELLVSDPAHPYSAALIAAVPEADPTITRTKKRVSLKGAEVPSLLNLPPGCVFHPRCPLFEPGLCDVLVPSLGNLPGGRTVACHVALRERQPAAELLGVH